MPTASGKISFGCWQLDVQRRMLCAHGTPMPVHGRGFDLLVFLAERRGRPVGKEEIFAGVWAGSTVSDGNLAVQVSNLRKALDDSGPNGGGLIVTVPGRGYMFTGELAEPPAPPPPTAPHTPEPPPTTASPAPTIPPTMRGREWRVRTASLAGMLVVALGAAALVWRPAPTAPRLSIAVLPFRNLSPDRTQDYLADALTDDLTTDLAHIPGSTVIARESADVWRGEKASVQRIGRALMVRYVLEGSLRVEEGHYHVNAQLLDTSNGAHLWTERLDFSDGTVSEVRNTIVSRLALALDFRLAQVESARSIHDRPDNPDALDLFFQARAVLDMDNSLPGLTRAQHLLERALLQEPDFSDAAAELGAVLMMKVEDTDDPQENADVGEAHRNIAHALALSPRNALALTARAREFMNENKWTEASFTARAALDVEPSNIAAHAALARCARAEGKLEEAAAEIESVLRLSPGSVTNKRRYLTLGFIRLMQGRTRDAVGNLHMAIAGDHEPEAQDTMGRFEVARLLLIAATAMMGNVEEAKAKYIDYSAIWPNRTVWRIAAFYRKSEVEMPAFTAVLSALERSGMPSYANEYDIPPNAAGACLGGDFDQSPTKASRSEVWHTSDLASHLRSDPALLVIDVGHGASVPKGAIWNGWGAESETYTEFAERAIASHSNLKPGDAVVVMGDGVFGCDSYKLAESVSANHPTLAVKWYRGGEEAWAKARLPSEDRRP